MVHGKCSINVSCCCCCYSKWHLANCPQGSLSQHLTKVLMKAWWWAVVVVEIKLPTWKIRLIGNITPELEETGSNFRATGLEHKDNFIKGRKMFCASVTGESPSDSQFEPDRNLRIFLSLLLCMGWDSTYTDNTVIGPYLKRSL